MKNNQKGSVAVILLVVVVVVILAGVVGYFAFVKKSGPIAQQLTPTPIQVTSTPKSNPTPTPTPTDPTANWKIYISSQFGFAFKYPNEYAVKEESYGVQIYDSAKTDYYGNPIFLINFEVQTTDKNLDSIISNKIKEFSVSGAIPTTINGLPAYEGLDLGMFTRYAVFFKNSSNLIEIQFRTVNSSSINNEGLQKYKAALTTNQKLILSTFKFTSASSQNLDLKTYTNTQYGFEFQYPYKNISVADGFVASMDPKGLVFITNIFTIPHGQDRDGLIGVFNLPLTGALQSLGFAGQNLPTVNYNGITWTKLPRQDTPSDYLAEKNGKTFWLGYDGNIKQADFDIIINSFKFTK